MEQLQRLLLQLAETRSDTFGGGGGGCGGGDGGGGGGGGGSGGNGGGGGGDDNTCFPHRLLDSSMTSSALCDSTALRRSATSF